MEPGWLELAALIPIAFLGALLYGITGFGSALVTIPLATHVVSLPFALAIYAVVDWLTSMRVGIENPRLIVKGEWLRISSTIVIGSALGMTALFHLPRHGLMIALGVFIIAYALYALAVRGEGRTVSQRWAYVAGIGGGLSGTLFGAGGPPYAIYLTHRPLSKDHYRATMSATSVVSITIRVIAYTVTGLLLDKTVWLMAALSLPAAMAGLYMGTKIFHRIDRATLARAIALLLLATGATLIGRAVM
ncbi:MAG: sulfite exporter TauE/SafE family protein [Burkholderiales bacterium]